MTRRPPTPRKLTTLTLAGLALASLGVAAPIWAQSYETGGIQLRFGLGLGVDAASNRTLDPDDADSSVEARARLSFGLLTETRTQRLSLDASGTFRNITGDGATGLNEGFANPAIGLDYSRSSVDATLSFSARLSESDLADNALVFDEDTGTFTLLDGTATRRSTSTSLRYNWGEDAPVGFGVSALLQRNSFRNGVATDVDGTVLNDSTRLTLGASTRIDLNEATQISLGLTFSQFDQDGDAQPTRDTLSLNTTLRTDRPLGPLSFTLGVTDTEDGTRYSLTGQRSLAYPLGTLTGRLGVVRGVSGDTVLSAGLSATRDLPRGGLNVSFARDVSSGNQQDAERVNTSLQLGYQFELSRLASISLNFDVGDTRLTATDQSTTSATFSAAYRRELTRDWNMNTGIRHRYRDDDISGTARSNELFLNLNRTFVTRF